MWKREHIHGQMLCCTGLGDFCTTVYVFFEKLFLENSKLLVKKLLPQKLHAESETQQGFRTIKS